MAIYTNGRHKWGHVHCTIISKYLLNPLIESRKRVQMNLFTGRNRDADGEKGQ